MCFVCCAVRVRSHAVGRCAVRCDAHMKVQNGSKASQGPPCGDHILRHSEFDD